MVFQQPECSNQKQQSLLFKHMNDSKQKAAPVTSEGPVQARSTEPVRAGRVLTAGAPPRSGG